MRNITDRIVQHPMRFKFNAVPENQEAFDLESIPGTITSEGSNLDRSLLLAIQGFDNTKTSFLQNGSIQERNESDNSTLTTSFPSNDIVKEVFSSSSGTISKYTRFLSNGTIETWLE